MPSGGSAYQGSRHQAKLKLMITHRDITNGDDTNNAPSRGDEVQRTNWVTRGRSEEREGN